MVAVAKMRTRAELIDEFVMLDAVASVVIAMTADSGNRGAPWGQRVVADAVSNAIDTGLNELWPDEDDLKSDEYRSADRRATLLAAVLFSQLAADPDYCARRSDALLGSLAQEERA